MAGIKPSDIIVFGKSGQVGSAFYEMFGDEATFFDFPEMDFSKPQEIAEKIKNLKAKIIINAAAYTAVDKAEQEENLADKINAESVEVIAKHCAKNNIALVHYSTDYVFPGTGEKPWTEKDKTAPLNAYGRSKLKGDEAIAASGAKHLIFRTCWVYDHQGKNFLLTMLKLGKEREVLKVVNDQIGAPTYAAHIAKYSLEAATKALGMKEFPSGVYNLCNSGETNWHEFAKSIFAEAKKKNIEMKIKDVQAIPSSEYPTPAKRPHNSRMNLEKLKNAFAIQMPTWRDAMVECMERI